MVTHEHHPHPGLETTAQKQLVGILQSGIPIRLGDLRRHNLNLSPRPWASPPSKPMVDRNGVVLKDEAGKVKYSPIVELTSKEIRNRWSSAVIDAMRAAHPEAFDS